MSNLANTLRDLANNDTTILTRSTDTEAVKFEKEVIPMIEDIVAKIKLGVGTASPLIATFVKTLSQEEVRNLLVSFSKSLDGILLTAKTGEQAKNDVIEFVDLLQTSLKD